MENLDFEQMKAQMAVLQNKIATQEIVNDRLISESMKDKMSWIKKYIILLIVAIPLAMYIWVDICKTAHIPLWFTLILLIGCIIDGYYGWKINITPIKDNDFERQNLIETAEKLRKMKRQRAIQTIVGLIAFVLLMLLAGVYLYINNIRGANVFSELNAHNLEIIGGGVGLVIGTIVGMAFAWKMYKRSQRTNDAIIQQIEELNTEE